MRSSKGPPPPPDDRQGGRMARSTTGLFRTRGEHGHAPVTYIELFFDLVFVFAITQLSHGLLEHLGWTGALQTLILLFAVWWVWIYTTWVANWLDPARPNVRLMLIPLILAGLVISRAISQDLWLRGWTFPASLSPVQNAVHRGGVEAS